MAEIATKGGVAPTERTFYHVYEKPVDTYSKSHEFGTPNTCTKECSDDIHVNPYPTCG